MIKKKILFFLLTTLAVVSLVVGWFLVTQPIFFFPKYEYAHIRLRIFIEGVEYDLGDNPNGNHVFLGACSGILQKEPLATIQKDPHTIRLMWKGITGKTLFRFLGIEKGNRDLMSSFSPQFGWHTVVLPTKPLLPLSKDVSYFFFVRTGEGFIERPIELWKHTSIENIFGRSSQIRVSWFTPTIAYAHEEENDINTTSTNPFIIVQEQEEARRLNNVLGEGALFIQHERPATREIQNAFDTFPLLSGNLCDEAT